MDKVIIKTPEEIEKMRELGRLVAEALDYIGQFVKPGVTTNEIDKLIYDYHVNVQGGYPAPLNYGNPPYPKSCCTSVNHVICHGIPDDKPLKEGDIVNIDDFAVPLEETALSGVQDPNGALWYLARRAAEGVDEKTLTQADSLWEALR